MTDHETGRTIIKITANGPIIVQGSFDVLSADGTPMAEGKGTVALCRCGASASKPFCDGAHTRIGFQG